MHKCDCVKYIPKSKPFLGGILTTRLPSNQVHTSIKIISCHAVDRCHTVAILSSNNRDIPTQQLQKAFLPNLEPECGRILNHSKSIKLMLCMMQLGRSQPIKWEPKKLALVQSYDHEDKIMVWYDCAMVSSPGRDCPFWKLSHRLARK